MIPRYLATFIPPDVRSRGDGYVTGRRVIIARASASAITALVNGTTGYVVTLLATAGRFELTCTCAHRIGQTRRVIATRLVARRTIEEKILTLQASKRALADAILTADQGVLARIGRAELEALLGSE